MIDFARGYQTLANNGDKMDLYFINRVEDLEGNILYQRKIKHDYVLNSNYVYILNEMLTSTSNSAFNDYTTPTALSLASRMSRKYALKTGTTNTDSWSVGYTNDLLMLVWIGNDDAKEIDSKASVYGKEIWLNTMEDYLADQEDEWYSKPPNVVGVVKDAITGDTDLQSKNNTLFYYVKGSELSIPNNEKNN